MARVNPRRWPWFNGYLQSKLRHIQLPGGCTPFSAVHGFPGSTALESSPEALEAIPSDLVTGAWLKAIRKEAAIIDSTLKEQWAYKAEQRARKI